MIRVHVITAHTPTPSTENKVLPAPESATAEARRTFIKHTVDRGPQAGSREADRTSQVTLVKRADSSSVQIHRTRDNNSLSPDKYILAVLLMKIS